MLRDWVVVLKAFVVVVVGLVTREVVVRTRCGSLRKVLVMKLYADCCLMNAGNVNGRMRRVHLYA